MAKRRENSLPASKGVKSHKYRYGRKAQKEQPAESLFEQRLCHNLDHEGDNDARKAQKPRPRQGVTVTRNEKLRDHQGEDKAEQAIGRDNANKSPLQMRHWRRGFSSSLTARRRHHEQGAGHRREHGDHCKQQPVDAYGLSEGRQQAGSEYDEKRNPGARRSIQPSKAFAPYHGEQTAAQAEQRAGHDA